jgi:hypothetical protein
VSKALRDKLGPQVELVQLVQLEELEQQDLLVLKVSKA